MEANLSRVAGMCVGSLFQRTGEAARAGCAVIPWHSRSPRERNMSDFADKLTYYETKCSQHLSRVRLSHSLALARGTQSATGSFGWNA